MSGLVSIQLTQDIIEHPEQYPTLFKNGLSSCTSCLEEFKKEEKVLGGTCQHYTHFHELKIWLKQFPKEITDYDKISTLQAFCPDCKDSLNSEDITELTKAQVLEKRKAPIKDESSKEKERADTTSEVNELENELLAPPPSNPNYPKEKLHKVVIIAAKATIATALIFISVRAMQS